jgi:hypothetical protein
MTVIDPDAPDTPDEPDGLAYWNSLNIDQTGCLIVGTPGGGRHVYFDEAGIGNSDGPLGEHGIHVRGRGGYVIAPECARSDGKRYTVLQRGASVLPPMPKALLDLLIPERLGTFKPLDARRSSAAAVSVPIPAPTLMLEQLLKQLTPEELARWRKYAGSTYSKELLRVSMARKGRRRHTTNNAAFAIGRTQPISEHPAFEKRLIEATKECGYWDEKMGEALQTIRTGLSDGANKPINPLDVLNRPWQAHRNYDVGTVPRVSIELKK